jgi:hypothetical protein
MRRSILLFLTLLSATVPAALAKKQDHQWNVGKILDENRARYYVGTLHDSSSQTSESGNWNGSANSTSIGDSTNTQASGTYSGTSTTSTSGFSDSTPSGADIEIDDAFVGNTPSTVSVPPGSHKIAVKKKGFADWTKTLNVSGGSIHLSAELDPDPPKQ